ncbi:TetR/AcrR family transcriptional regulator [Herbiconiux liukaitaii]|uniref:TetR/AcrR family transcriptional regulator n=1 Tax=Herbiconiux liukaitaii TaxID=3342799 RepID=UPI0035B98D4E
MNSPPRAARTGSIRPRTEIKLLDAAEELFFTRGIAATSIDAVLARAGVSAATLYRGYPSKEALVAAALERRQAAWVQTWTETVEQETSAEGRLLAVFTALDRFRERPFRARWCAFLGSSAEYSDPPVEVDRAVRADTLGFRLRLTELAEPLVGDRAPELAEQLLLVVSGDLAMRLRDDSVTAPTGTARTIASALLAGHQQQAAGLRQKGTGLPQPTVAG